MNSRKRRFRITLCFIQRFNKEWFLTHVSGVVSLLFWTSECLYKDIYISPSLVFSVALDRGSFAAENSSDLDQNLGFIAFGGIAPVDVTDSAVTVPVQGYNAASFLPENGSSVTYFYYTVDVESMSFTGNKKVFGTTNSMF